VGGLVDIAPTVFHLLNKPVPSQWQGTSLLQDGNDGSVFFFAPWSDYLFGFRQGNLKCIYNATKNTTEVYDLKADPFEQNDISKEHAGDLEIYHQKLAGWAQYVNSQISQITKQKRSSEL
jgi:arylsulfatase A-like enzyme